jgi:hypothetical protein
MKYKTLFTPFCFFFYTLKTKYKILVIFIIFPAHLIFLFIISFSGEISPLKKTLRTWPGAACEQLNLELFNLWIHCVCVHVNMNIDSRHQTISTFAKLHVAVWNLDRQFYFIFQISEIASFTSIPRGI